VTIPLVTTPNGVGKRFPTSPDSFLCTQQHCFRGIVRRRGPGKLTTGTSHFGTAVKGSVRGSIVVYHQQSASDLVTRISTISASSFAMARFSI